MNSFICDKCGAELSRMYRVKRPYSKDLCKWCYSGRPKKGLNVPKTAAVDVETVKIEVKVEEVFEKMERLKKKSKKSKKK